MEWEEEQLGHTCPILLENIPKIYTTLSKNIPLSITTALHSVLLKHVAISLVKGTEYGMISSQAVQMFEVLKGTIISYYGRLVAVLGILSSSFL